MSNEAVKNDEEKLRFDLISPAALRGIAGVLTYGAKKYSARNWELGLSYGRVYAALQRHLNYWWDREQFDPESKLYHLDHAACCLMFLQDYIRSGKGIDDRPIK